MLPILLNSQTVRAGLAGAGDGHARRATLLAEAGLAALAVSPDEPLPPLDVLFIAGLDAGRTAALAAKARAAGILVNAEDIPELCDFHVPAMVRRGDLILTASTGGHAPGLARRLREWLEGKFGPEWSGHLADTAQARARWRAAGLPPAEVSRRTRDLIAERGLLS